MNHSSQRQRILRKLAKLLEELQSEMGDEDLEAKEGDESIESETTPGCSIKVLPKQLQIQAARTAVKQNPVNAPRVTELGSLGIDASVMNPLSIAVITTKYWGPYQRRLTVSFLESTPTQLRKKILEHMNAWNKTAGISFTYVRQGGNVRITREDSGYWSYVGTDVLHINANRPTMCLQDFSTSTPTSEYRRVVRHETGHTLGFPHEHMRKELVARLDRQKCYDYFGRTQGWTRQEVDAQVLTPLSRESIFGTQPDQTSIMCYQLPGSITKDGKPILGGTDINQTDYEWAGKIYPKSVASRSTTEDSPDWEDDADVPEEQVSSSSEVDMSCFTEEPLDL